MEPSTAAANAGPTEDEMIGELVHQALWRSRRSQTDLARALGVDQGSVSRRLRGKIAWHTMSTTIRKAAGGVALALVLGALAACGSSSSSSAPAASTVAGQAAAATTPPAGEAGPDEQVCHDKSFILMRDALLKDGNFDSLPKLPDRSLGITECKGLTGPQLDAIAARLQVELQPFMLGAAASATP